MDNLAYLPDSRGPRSTPKPIRRLAIVTPVLDDWPSFAMLVRRIDAVLGPEVEWIEIIAVDDGSAEDFDRMLLPGMADQRIGVIRIVHLALNLGHQRAIAVGLVTLAGREDLDAIIVMDSDGEDRPEDMAVLLATAGAAPDRVILAHRAKRSESVLFRLGYRAYKTFFRLLTGRGISFGNFSLLPLAAARRLVHMPELWNNLPAAIMRSRLRYDMADTVRGARYAGRSKMSLSGLIIHGMSAMSVYTDLIFTRVLLAAAGVSVVSVLALLLVLGVRLGTSLAIPGWATIVFGDLLIILFQAMLMIVATSLMVLASRSARPIVPIADAPVFIRDISEIFPGRPTARQPASRTQAR